MEYFIPFLIGVATGSAFWITCIRRAAAKPDGKTAKVMTIMGGGGPDPRTP
jgi:hypothetical protein